jgi:hypothetical protein
MANGNSSRAYIVSPDQHLKSFEPSILFVDLLNIMRFILLCQTVHPLIHTQESLAIIPIDNNPEYFAKPIP